MMALTTQLWTINGLSVEFGISSRVLGRRLSDLPPDQVEHQAGRQVKRWRLARVLRHLKAADRTSAGPTARRQTPSGCGWHGRGPEGGARNGRPRTLPTPLR